jgi:uncharacterized protein
LAARPSSRSERIDALRGLAVFGILLVNVWAFAYGYSSLRYGVLSQDATAPDRLAVFFAAAFAEQKFYPVFAFLFGAGFALQMRSLRRRAGELDPALRIYRRRLKWLLACGLLHGTLIWFGDVLTAYAVTGFWLLRVARHRLAGVARLLLIVLFVNAALLLPLLAIALLDDGAPAAAIGEMVREVERAHAIYSLGGWGEIARTRLKDFGLNLSSFVVFLPRVALLFLLGVCAVRLGWLTRPERHRASWRKVLMLGLGLGLPFNLWWGYVAMQGAVNPWDPVAGAELAWFMLDLAGPCLGAAYVAALMLAGAHLTGALAAWLAPVGRMALTNYLMQSLLGVALLQGVGLGLGARLSHSALLALCAAIMLFQLCFSRWWMARHAQGPLEALWRRYTYRPLRNRE